MSIRFEPLFFPRVWGGRMLQEHYGKQLPAQETIGEAWELVDRPEAQSMVRDGEWRGRSLHDLWVNERDQIFGKLPEAPRFPLLIKLLDCREALSLQVHPPAETASEMGGEPKTEAWYIVHAKEGAELYLGMKENITPERFSAAVQEGKTADCLQRVKTRSGQLYLVPSGEAHAIGGGNLILEVQQNSDTTYRVFDWNRTDAAGGKRELHLGPALRSINFNAASSTLRHGDKETLTAENHFRIDQIEQGQEFAPSGQFAIGFVVRGHSTLADESFRPGELFLLPARAAHRRVEVQDGLLLRITIP